jgi:DNA-binding transcriptional MerR regulator
MKITKFAELSGISVASARRWTDLYASFLTTSARPPRGQVRVLTPHDQRVLWYVVTMRNDGRDQDVIMERLKEMQAQEWQRLPDIPLEWGDSGDTVPVDIATARAGEMVQIAILQKELEHTQRQLESAENRVRDLERQLQQKVEVEAEKSGLQLELERARGEVTTLKAQLDAYVLAYGMGRNKPINLVVLVGIVALAVAVLMALAVVLGALVG